MTEDAAGDSALAARLAERIRRRGPLPFDQWMEAALYESDGGFFARAGGAGRAGGDFVTSVEVGSLFGALVARAVDGWWAGLGGPDRIYQAACSLPVFDRQRALIGSWVIAGQAAGMGIREDRAPITTNASRFVPHYFR